MGGELRVLLIGAGGYFGRLLAEELARLPDCSIVATGRGGVPAPAGLPFVRADLAGARSVERALDGAQAAICAAGPFGGLPPTLARACLARGVHYADLADDRGFVARVRALAAAAGIVRELPVPLRARSAAACVPWPARLFDSRGLARPRSPRGATRPPACAIS